MWVHEFAVVKLKASCNFLNDEQHKIHGFIKIITKDTP